MRGKIVNLIIVLVSLMVGIFGTLYFVSNKEDSKDVSSSSYVNKNVKVTETSSINDSIEKVYDSVVVVSNYQRGQLAGYGSGFVYKKDSKYGYILTNYHVVNGASEIKVTLSSGEEIDAKVLGGDSYMDVAAIRIDASKVLAVAQLGDSTKSKLGDTVFTVGSPVSTDYMGTVTKGIISGENREITVTNNNSSYMMEVIQIDASINPGNSGGPLVNINGEVIGINSVKLVDSSIEGMGFAIPIEVATSQIEKLEKGEEIARPVIGVSLFDLDSVSYLYGSKFNIASNVKNGVVINEVSEGSDAESAGLKAGDVIVKVDGTSVKSSAHLKYLLYKHNIGDSVKVTINRSGDEKELTLKLTHKLGE